MVTARRAAAIPSGGLWSVAFAHTPSRWRLSRRAQPNQVRSVRSPVGRRHRAKRTSRSGFAPASRAHAVPQTLAEGHATVLRKRKAAIWSAPDAQRSRLRPFGAREAKQGRGGGTPRDSRLQLSAGGRSSAASPSRPATGRNRETTFLPGSVAPAGISRKVLRRRPRGPTWPPPPPARPLPGSAPGSLRQLPRTSARARVAYWRPGPAPNRGGKAHARRQCQ